MEPIDELAVKVEKPMPEGWHKIPVYSWSDVVHYAKSHKTEIQKGHAETLTNADVNDAGFLIELSDESMYPQFPSGTEIIVNTEYEPMDREMVVVYLKRHDKAFFRMVIFNGNDKFVRNSENLLFLNSSGTLDPLTKSIGLFRQRFNHI